MENCQSKVRATYTLMTLGGKFVTYFANEIRKALIVEDQTNFMLHK
jgi:hypothetical protein